MQTITVTHSPRGHKLQEPLTLSVPETQNAADEKLQQYVIDSLSWKMSSLVAFTFDNTSTLEVAKHLLRHRTGSTATLYQYIYGIHRFCKWANTQPDQLIESCLDQVGDPKPKGLAKYSRLLDDFVDRSIKQESQDLSDSALDRMLLSIKQDIVNDKGFPDSESIQIQLQEQFTVKVGRNRAYRLRKRLLTLYGDVFPISKTSPE